MKITSKEIVPIQNQAASLSIVDQPTLAQASEYLSQANKMLDTLEADRLSLTKPINDSLKAIRAKYRPLEDALNAIVEVIKTKMIDYQSSLVKAQREAELAISAKVESGYIKPETAISKLEALGEVQSKTETESGSVQFVEVRKFEVTDLALVPLAYHLPDLVAIRKAMLAGEPDIAGVKYFTIQQPKNYR
jgi:hypothetical protein